MPCRGLARKGEHDPERVRNEALKTLGELTRAP
jgi:hypothetical protein